jgi:hypothetical protein
MYVLTTHDCTLSIQKQTAELATPVWPCQHTDVHNAVRLIHLSTEKHRLLFAICVAVDYDTSVGV